jgi:glycosyltransferase involved in cell wall biosynthesis
MVASVRLRFLTSTPLDVARGSGTYVGISALARALQALGHHVEFRTPRIHLPIYTAERLLFNRLLRPEPGFDLTIGFDMDGYRCADIAALKGVIADEVRFESGLTRFTMGIQARRERLHVRRARRVLVTSRYSAERARAFYQLDRLPSVVPELIDLAEWRDWLARHPAESPQFTVLFVGRLYRRKRVDVLLRAAALARPTIPGLEVRIVGNGPCAPPLRRLAHDLHLDNTVTWLGDVSRSALAEEYNRATMFCLPSVQEGFGIVLLEAMAAHRPIVAACAAAIPEVVPHAALVEPENPAALAAAFESLYRWPEQRSAQAAAGAEWVQQFDAPRVARLFLEAATEPWPTCALA